MELPDPPKQERGSFWNMGNGPISIWDVAVKLLIWGSVLGVGLYLAFALASD